MTWFAHRCVIDRGGHYEERVTVWQAESWEEARELGISEASGYALSNSGAFLDFEETIQLDGPPQNGALVFLRKRKKELSPGEFLDRHFDTRHMEGPTEADREGHRQMIAAESEELHGTSWQWAAFKDSSSGDHLHCHFCYYVAFAEHHDDQDCGCLREGWTRIGDRTDPHYEYWVCPECFERLKDTFRWTTEAPTTPGRP